MSKKKQPAQTVEPVLREVQPKLQSLSTLMKADRWKSCKGRGISASPQTFNGNIFTKCGKKEQHDANPELCFRKPTSIQISN